MKKLEEHITLIVQALAIVGIAHQHLGNNPYTIQCTNGLSLINPKVLYSKHHHTSSLFPEFPEPIKR